jgi:hypothetical protein
MRWLTALLLLLVLSSAAANRRERLHERRRSILQRDLDALELQHASLQPVGEVAARVAGGRRYVQETCQLQTHAPFSVTLPQERHMHPVASKPTYLVHHAYQ